MRTPARFRANVTGIHGGRQTTAAEWPSHGFDPELPDAELEPGTGTGNAPHRSVLFDSPVSGAAQVGSKT